MDLKLKPIAGGVLKGACPACGYPDAFTVRQGDTGVPIYWCAACRDQQAILKAMRGSENAASEQLVKVKRVAYQKRGPLTPEEKTQAALAIWRRGVSAAHTSVQKYLESRGIKISIPPTLRYVGRSKHLPSETWWPMMVGAVTVWPSRDLCAVHRTYLDQGIKAPVNPNKKTLGKIDGGAIRLAPAGPVLVIGEGIETCLSVMQVTGLPAWSAIAAGNLPRIVLPPPSEVRHVIIAADNDDHGVGMKSAREAAERLEKEGRQVSIHMPSEVGKDFNDVLAAE